MITNIKRLLPILLLSLTLPTQAQDNYKVVIDYQFDDTWLSFSSNGLAAVKKGNKWGYIGKDGKVVIDYQYELTYGFSINGLASVKKDGKWGYVDQNGKKVIDYQFDFTFGFSSIGLAAVQKDDKWGFVDQTGKMIIEYLFEDARSFSSNGLAAMQKGGKWGYIDKEGKIVIACKFDDAYLFSSNMACVKKAGRWGYIDQTGRVVIDFQFDDSRNFALNGLACVKKAGRWGYIDQTGRVVIDFQFDGANTFSSEGLTVVKNGDKWGYINQSGNIVIGYQFDYASNFSQDGFAAAKKEGKWGCVDKAGNVVVNYQFDLTAGFFSKNLVAVKKGDKWGFISLQSPSDDITDYVKSEILKWQVKGKYEPTEDYKIRVGDVNRKKKLEELSDKAVQIIAQKYCDLKIISSEYDADNQTTKITAKGLPPFYIKVPLNEAESLDKSISEVQFQNIEYALGNDSKFFLQKATIKNPNNGRIYNFSSTDTAVFAYTQLNMNFEPLQLNIQTAENNIAVKTESKTVSVGMSDVDLNIPSNPQSNDKTFVVIIANENYSREVKVQFAANDGKIFKDYCEKTLGIPTKNIHYSQDATYGTMKSEIKWISDVIGAFNGQAKVIFYYAGHGMPNEADKSAYLLPVDGFSSDFETAIKLDDLYNRLNSNPSQSVTVFLDACFSGSLRDNGMLANARGVKIRPRMDMIKGNMVVFSAATGDETAYPYKEKQHGLFTYFLLKKLQETKGNVDYQTLSNYITEQVKQQSIVVNQKSQTPQVNTSTEVQNSWQLMRIK